MGQLSRKLIRPTKLDICHRKAVPPCSLRELAYILKKKQSADFTFQSKKICGKSAQIATTTKVRMSIKSLRNASFEN